MSKDNFNNDSNSQILLKYLNLEAELIANTNIPWSAKALFSLIKLLDDPKKGCWASNQYLANHLLLTTQTISNHIQLLAKYEYITTNGRNERRIIRINPAYIEIYKPLIKKFIHNNKETNRDSFYTKKKEVVFEKNKVDESKELKKNPLIDFWNELPNTSKHKKRTTKTYKKITAHLNQLKSGVFSKRNKLDQDFLTRNKITNGLLSKQYTTSELREGLLRLSNMLTEGYWPFNKEKLPKSLQQLLFNPHTGSSMFLKVMAKAPEQLSKSKLRRPVDRNEDMTESLLERKLIVLDDLSIREIRVMFKHLQAIKNYHTEALEYDRFGNKLIRYEQPHKLLDDYLKWIDDQEWLEGFKLSLLNIENKPWKLFTKWASECIGETLN